MLEDIPPDVIPTIYGGPNNVTEGCNYDDPHNNKWFQ